jgi:putative ABC transport system permease protein
MTKRRFYIKMALCSLIRRRSRMVVALLAVAVGATILSGLTAVYYDMPRQMGQEFRSYGANLVLLPAGADGLRAEAVDAALRLLPAGSLVGAAPYRYRTARINGQTVMAAGTDIGEARKTSPYWLVAGRWPEAAGEALVGLEVANTLRLVQGAAFDMTGVNSAGEPFTHGFSVAGILQTGGAEEAFVFVSTDGFRAMTGEDADADAVECSVSAEADALEDAAERIGGTVPGVSARLVKRLTQSEGAVLGKLKALVWLVTVIVLLLIMICFATTMMAVVAERRREIGLRKALGAANGSLVLEFLGEGALIGLAGGLLGAGSGIVFARFVGLNVFSRAVAFPPMLVPITALASVLITALACLVPVRSAVDVDPAIVLRGE